MPRILNVDVESLQVGDEFHAEGYHHYTVTGSPEVWEMGKDVFIRVPVVFRDGGQDVRTWLPGTKIQVVRRDV